MSATFATSARPAWAVTCWADDNNIFVEFPCKDGPPLISKYPLTESGLSKALSIMRSLHKKESPKGGYFTAAEHPKTKKALPNYTDSQRSNALAVLKRLKIV